MRYFKIILLILLGAFLVIQLIRPKKNIHKGPEATANNISKVVSVAPNIAGILDRACNDCHSNNTRYPWYSNIMPVGWILDNHVTSGKKHLNLDEFAAYAPKKQAHKLEEIANEVKEGGMPISSYTKMHKEARLSDEEKAALVSWATDAQSKIVVPPGQNNPPPPKPE